MDPPKGTVIMRRKGMTILCFVCVFYAMLIPVNMAPAPTNSSSSSSTFTTTTTTQSSIVALPDASESSKTKPLENAAPASHVNTSKAENPQGASQVRSEQVDQLPDAGAPQAVSQPVDQLPDAGAPQVGSQPVDQLPDTETAQIAAGKTIASDTPPMAVGNPKVITGDKKKPGENLAEKSQEVKGEQQQAETGNLENRQVQTAPSTNPATQAVELPNETPPAQPALQNSVIEDAKTGEEPDKQPPGSNAQAMQEIEKPNEAQEPDSPLPKAPDQVPDAPQSPDINEPTGQEQAGVDAPAPQPPVENGDNTDHGVQKIEKPEVSEGVVENPQEVPQDVENPGAGDSTDTEQNLNDTQGIEPPVDEEMNGADAQNPPLEENLGNKDPNMNDEEGLAVEDTFINNDDVYEESPQSSMVSNMQNYPSSFSDSDRKEKQLPQEEAEIITNGGEFNDDEDSHFFAYFLTIMVSAIIFYLVFHNKQRIIALIIEGRSPGSRRGRRSSSRGKYHKLDNNLEEAMTATKGANT